MIEDIEKQLIKKSGNIVNKFYDDVLHPPAKEIGLFLRDIVKTACLLGAPFAIGSALKDRLSDKMCKIAESVPEDLRVMPNPQLFFDYLDKTKFMPESSSMMRLFDRLLVSSMNKETRNLIHPAFMLILPQLSEDEIIIINRMKNAEFKIKQRHHYNAQTNKFYKVDIFENEFPLDALHNKDLYFMYCTHLDKLDLINLPMTAHEIERDASNRQTAEVKIFTFQLSEFGKLFVQAVCSES